MSQKFRSRLEIWTSAGRLGILADAFNVRVREVVNGEYYVQFLYPRQPGDEERYAALVEDNDVKFPPDVERGQIFRIKRVEEIREGLKIYKLVEAHHIAFTLGQYFHDGYIDFAAAKTLPEMLTILGEGTPFTFAVEGNFAPQDIFEWGEKSKLELLHELRELYGAELAFDNYEITLTTRKGGNYGARVRYRHNMKGIKRTSHSMERITRLYGYGKNGLTIEGYQGHSVKYIDSEYFDPNNPYMGKMEWPEIEDQGRLLQEMQKYLKKHELPKVSYDVDFVQMEKVDPEFEAERIREAGDTVTCFDEVLWYSFDARAMEFERYPFEPQRGRVVLANFREFKTSDYIFQATVGSKKAIQYTSKNAVLKGVKYDDSLTLVDGLGMNVTDDANVERVRIGQIGPGRYGLRVDSGYIEITGKLPDSQIASAANWNGKTTLLLPNGIYTGTVRATQIIVGEAGEKIGDNLIDSAATWNGKTTLLTPEGVYTGKVKANQIEAGTLSAISANLGSVTAGSISGVSITGGTIFGAAITGGTITGATIQTSGSYPRIELVGNDLYAYDKKLGIDTPDKAPKVLEELNKQLEQAIPAMLELNKAEVRELATQVEHIDKLTALRNRKANTRFISGNRGRTSRKKAELASTRSSPTDGPCTSWLGDITSRSQRNMRRSSAARGSAPGRRQTGDFARAEGQKVMENLLQAHGDQINAVYAHNDEMAIGAINAIKAAGKVPGKDIVIVSVDGTRDALNAIIAGEMGATVESSPFFGPPVFDVIEKLEKGEQVPTEIIIEDRFFDQSNAAEFVDEAY